MSRRCAVVLLGFACSAPDKRMQDAADAADAPANACPAIVAEMPVSTGGTRLRPIYWTSPDGLDIPAGFFDRVFQQPCEMLGTTSYGMSVVGALSCVPEPYPSEPLTYPDYGPVSLDASCSQGSGRPAWLGGPGLANTWVHGALLGADLVPAPPTYCSPFEGNSPPAGYHVYPIVETKASAGYVGDFYQGLTANNAVLFLLGDDGSKIFTGKVFDIAHDACAPFEVLPSDIDAGRWLPPEGGPCPTGLCPDECPNFYLGAKFTTVGNVVMRMEPARCMVHYPNMPPDGVLGWTPIGEIPLADFDPAPHVEIGGSRLVMRARADDGFPIIVPPHEELRVGMVHPLVHDKQLDIDCRPEIASDGTMRCLPPALRVREYVPGFDPVIWYTDPSCTSPVAAVPVFSGGPIASVARDVQGSFETCGPNVYRVGAELARPTQLYGHVSNSNTIMAWSCSDCRPIFGASVSELPAARFFAASLLDATSFAPMSVVTR